MTNANSMMAGFVNPMARTVKRYRWDGTLPFVPNPANLLSTQGGANRALDPDLELPYTDEFVVGLDQQLRSGTAVRFNYVRKLERNRMKLQNTAIPFDAYNIPTSFTDRGRDFASTADDRVLTLYSLDRAYVGRRADVLMNDPLFTADYATYNVEVVKRLSGKSQVLTGFDVSHYDTWGFASAISQDIATDTGGFGVPQDPNRLTYNNRQDYWHWQYKFLGSYELPWQISIVGVDSHHEGRTVRAHAQYHRPDTGHGQSHGGTDRHVLLSHRATPRPAFREESSHRQQQARRAVRHLQRDQFSGDSQRQHADRAQASAAC